MTHLPVRSMWLLARVCACTAAYVFAAGGLLVACEARYPDARIACDSNRDCPADFTCRRVLDGPVPMLCYRRPDAAAEEANALDGGADDGGSLAGQGASAPGAKKRGSTMDSAGQTGGARAGNSGMGGVSGDLCERNNGGCDPSVSCESVEGRVECGACKRGWRDVNRDATRCDEIDECATDNGGCAVGVTCTNTPGSRVCGECPLNHRGQGDTECTPYWGVQLGSNGTDGLTALAVDRETSTFVVVGDTNVPVASDDQTTNTDTLVRRSTFKGEPRWEQSLVTDMPERSRAVAIDGGGRTWVVGSTLGAFERTASKGAWDAFAAVYEPGGALLRVALYGGEGSDSFSSIAIGPDGKTVAVAGSTNGSLHRANDEGRFDCVIAMLDAEGEILWLDQFLGPLRESLSAVAVDAEGNVYAAGNADHESDDSKTDLIVVKYNSAGVNQWREIPKTPDSEWASALATDNDDSVYVVGLTTGGTGDQTNMGRADAFVTKFAASNGTRLWTKLIGTAEWDTADSVVVDGDRNVLVCGATYANLAGQPVAQAERDLFVAKLDPAGTVLWLTQLHASQQQYGCRLALEADGELLVAGTTEAPMVGTTAVSGSTDLFVARLDREGNRQ